MDIDALLPLIFVGALGAVLVLFIKAAGKGVDPHEAARLRKLHNEIRVEKEKKEASEKLALQLLAAEKGKADATKKLEEHFTALKSNLPFYISTITPSAELADHDKKMWGDVTKLVEEQYSKKATLYFVKIKSLMDDNEYYKIGITSARVEARFEKSTQLELIEVIKAFDTKKWKAAFLEYHFLREFRLYDALSTSIGEQRPEVGFSGYTECVRSNSVNKISGYFEKLDVYNQMID